MEEQEAMIIREKVIAFIKNYCDKRKEWYGTFADHSQEWIERKIGIVSRNMEMGYTCHQCLMGECAN
jgi:hypothetical protein